MTLNKCLSFINSTGEAQLMNATVPSDQNVSVTSNGSAGTNNSDVESVTKGA